MFNEEKINLFKLGKLRKKTKKEKLKLFLNFATAGVLAGGIVLAHEKFAVNDLEEMCPISQLYYNLGDSQKAYEHQIDHYNKSCSDDKSCDFKYRSEEYTAPDGYDMNKDGKTCYTTDNTRIVEKDGNIFYVAPEGYSIQGDKCIKTIEANYQSEGIIVSDYMGEPTSMIYYDEEQSKLVKI